MNAAIIIILAARGTCAHDLHSGLVPVLHDMIRVHDHLMRVCGPEPGQE